MLLLPLSGRPRRPAVGLRTRLSVLALDDRAAPSSLGTSADEPLYGAALAATPLDPTSTTPAYGAPPHDDADPPNMPPEIVDFVVFRLDDGRYRLTGRVIDESPGGLVVNFGGIPSAVNQSATTRPDGAFELILTLQTDGSDAGVVTAVTRDAQGLSSNVAEYYVNPT